MDRNAWTSEISKYQKENATIQCQFCSNKCDFICLLNGCGHKNFCSTCHIRNPQIRKCKTYCILIKNIGKKLVYRSDPDSDEKSLAKQRKYMKKFRGSSSEVKFSL